MPGYDAFISYNHEDSAIAERISVRLRTYRAPRAAHLEKRLTIFRDVERLTASADLNEELRERVEKAEYLILIASPAAASSPYVDAEITAFLKTKSEDRIIVVLCEGESGPWSRNPCDLPAPTR